MVDIGLVLIDLPEPGHLVREALVAKAIGRLAFYILFKGKLRARQTATFGTPMAAKPRVQEVGKLVETNLSPTLAGLEATL